MASRKPPNQHEGAIHRAKARTLSSWVSSILAGSAPPSMGPRLERLGAPSHFSLGTPSMLGGYSPPLRSSPAAPASWTARPLGLAPTWRTRAPSSSRVDRLARVGRLIEQSRRASRTQPFAATSQSGVALMELMLVVGTIMVVSGGVFAVYRVAEANEKVARETQNAKQIAQNLTTVMAATGNFNGLNDTAQAVELGIIPDRMIDGASATSSWGGDVSLEPYTIGGNTGRGVLLTYEAVPSSACSRFISNVGPSFHTIKVNDAVLSQNFSTLSPAAISNLCSAARLNKVELVYVKDGGTGLATAPVSPCVAASPETQTVTTCPPGQLGEIVQGRDFVCLSPYGPSTPTPWTDISSTCAPICVAPPPSVSTTPQSRSTMCAAGRVTPAGASSFTQARTRTNTINYSCPAPTGPATASPPVYTYTAWSPTEASACAPSCAAPSPTSAPVTRPAPNETRSIACPAGQLGNTAQSRSRVENGTRTTSWTCPAPTGSATSSSSDSWSGTYTATSPWTTTSSTCAPECVAPATTTNNQTQSASCASGRLTPSGASTFTQTRSVTVSYSCPAPTGPSTANPPTYGAWSPMESQACAPVCTAPPPTTQNNSETATCPSGTYVKGPTTAQTTFTQTQQRSVNYSCPQPAGNYSTTYGSWSALDPTTAETCAARCVAPPTSITYTPQSRTWSCPSGQMTSGGSSTFTQNRTRTNTTTYSCPTYAGDYTTNPTTYSYGSGYTPTTTQVCFDACAAPPPSTETAPAPTQYRTLDCPAAQYGQIDQSRWVTHSRTVTNTCPAPTGAYTTTYSPWGAPYTYGAYQTDSTTCTNCPAPVTQTDTQWAAPYNVANCPAAYYGYRSYEREQIRSRTMSYSCPAGTRTLPPASYTAWSAFSNTGTIRQTSSSCTSCPSPVTQTDTQWVAYTANNCPASQYGYTNREREQIRSRTMFYSCPSGTLSLPPASYTAWSAFTNTGSTRYVSEACNGCPAPATETQNRWEGTTFGINNCPAGQYGHNNYEHYQVSTRTRSYNCPAGTSSLPPATYTAWSAWADTGTYRYTGSSCVGCPAPVTETAPQPNEYRALASCPASQYGHFYQYRTVTNTRTRSYTCPAGTSSLPPASYTGWSTSWGSWTTTSNDCTACPAPATETQNRWAGTTFGINNCPAGQYGHNNYEHYQVSTRTRSYNCPAGTTSLPPATYSSWSAWANTGTYRYTGSSCVSCPAATTESSPKPNEYRASALCPANQYGYHYQYRHAWDWRHVSYSCPAGTSSLPPANYTAWTPAYTDWTTSSNDCVTCPADYYQYRWLNASASCPSGQSGSHTWQYEQRRTLGYNCPAGTTSLPPAYVVSGYANTGATRNVVNTCAPVYQSCTLASSTLRTWGSLNCKGYQTAGTVSHGGQQTVTDPSFGPTAGNATYVCNNGTWGYSSGTCGPGTSPPGDGGFEP